MKIKKSHGSLLSEAILLIKHAFPYFIKHLLQKKISKDNKSIVVVCGWFFQTFTTTLTIVGSLASSTINSEDLILHTTCIYLTCISELMAQ